MNGELKAAMQYFTQAFFVRQLYPEIYDMLMNIATEEFSHYAGGGESTSGCNHLIWSLNRDALA